MTNHDRGIIYKMTSTLPRRVVAEFVGTAFLVAAVIGSGIMAERLSAGNVAHRVAGKFHCNRRSLGGDYPGLRRNFRRSFQSCRERE